MTDVDHPEGSAPGDPSWHRQARAEYALSRWSAAAPLRFREARATLPAVVAWAERAAVDPASAGALLLTGPTGTGKTFEAYGALRHIAASGPDRFEMIALTSADMYGTLRPSKTVGASEHELRRLCRVPFLLLDDFGTAKASEWTEEVTFRLLNWRYNECLPTVMTSNLPARDDQGGPDLTTFVGDRVASRLAEMATLVPVVGDDRRRRRGRDAA
ncbi:ATP-binding protein [Streptomyces sp. NPDC056773]|uniref:ATP-binding protein n=1 Tax=unclassified Streptomyces TaxID=2593676 RepID=UPI0036BB9A71